MKLHILREDQQPVEGFEIVKVSPNNMTLDHIVNNQCELILAPDIFDSFTVNAFPQLMQALVAKLRIGGELVLGGTDGRLLAKAVINGLLDVERSSNIVSSLMSATSEKFVRELVQSAGLKIASSRIDGLHFEIKAVRGQ